jgi:HEAT repeat protein
MFGATPLPRTLEAALRDVDAGKPAVRAASLRDLVAHAGDARNRVMRALQKALRDDEAAPVRAVAATALADIGAREALPDLLLAVDDDDVLVRQMAIAALGEIGDPRATERLRRALADERAEVRFQAVMAFPRVSASREASVEALLHATHDEDAFVCHIALRMTEEVRAGGPPDEHVVARARALLGHASVEVRVASAVLLAPLDGFYDGGSAPKPLQSPREAPSRALVTQVARGEVRTRDREDEAAAIELCGELGLERAQAGLEKRAFGRLLGLRRDPLAWHARVALARMGHERAGREILREIGARDRDVCTLAVAAAGRAHLTAARDRILALRGHESRADPHAVDEALAALADAALTNAPGSASQAPSTAPPVTSRA